LNPHGDLGILVAVVDLGSFTAAAASLSLSTSYVSRRVKALEDALGVRLLERTTRRVRPTAVGQAYRDQVAPLLEGLDEAARAAALLRAEPRGTLRLAAPTTFARRYMAEPIASFCAKWPELKVDASYSDRVVDLVADDFDLAIRGVQKVEENLVARRLLGFAGVLAASPDYLARWGRPEHPSDLESHACLVNTGLRTMPGWVFARDGETLRVDVDGPLCCDDGDALVAAAAAGMGICFEPDFLSASALRSGKIVPLLTDWPPYLGTLFAVYPNRRYLPVKVRFFIDHLLACWGQAPWEAPGDPAAGDPGAAPRRHHPA
jgi:DNA-binding transcriptional LysR family regulator